MATNAPFIFYRAEDIALVFTQLQADGVTPQNITGWTIAFRAASTQYGAAVITKTPTLTTPLSGIFTVNLASADTSALTQEGTDTVYYYDIRRTDAGSRVELFTGTLTVKDTPTNG
jgi:hypothetical protein